MFKKIRTISELKVKNIPTIELKTKGKILIDPGHGKNSKGQWKRPLMKLGNFSYREDLGTLEIAKLLRKRLNKEGYEVYLTREDDRDAKEWMIAKYGVSKWKSPTGCIRWYTKQVKPDIFISLHSNAGNEKASGPICFWGKEEDKDLAQLLSDQISEDFGIPNRGIKKRNFLIVRNSFPSVLFEMMFHTNEKDLGFLIHDQEKIAESLKKAVVKLFESRNL